MLFYLFHGLLFVCDLVLMRIARFRDIGYQHIPYFNCPNSPKCKGCKTGRFTDGEKFLFKEDCRPNWFEYVGMD